MDREKYLIFGAKLTSEDIANQDTTVQTTTALVDPVTLLNADAGTNKIIEVQLLKHSSHTAGSAYTTTDGEYFTIDPQGYTINGSTGVITIIAESTDDEYGVTLSGTPANNDFRVNLLKHIDGGTLSCFPVSKFKGVQLVNDTKTDIYFEAGTGDLDAVDVVEVEHGAGKFKQLVENLNDAMASNAPTVTKFFVGGNGGATGTSIDAVTFNGNPAGITNVAITLDT